MTTTHTVATTEQVFALRNLTAAANNLIAAADRARQNATEVRDAVTLGSHHGYAASVYSDLATAEANYNTALAYTTAICRDLDEEIVLDAARGRAKFMPSN